MDSPSGEPEADKSADNNHSPRRQSDAANNRGIRKPGKKKTKPPHDEAYWEKRQFRVQRLIAWAGVLGIIIYGLQLWEMRKSTDAATEANRRAREVMHLEQRAWVAISGISSVIEIGKEVSVTLTFMNSGRTFAHDVRFYGQARMVGIFAGTPTDAIDNRAVKSVPLMAPNTPFTAIIGREEKHVFSQEDSDALKYKTFVLFLRAKVSYKDVFGCGHWTTVCARFDPTDNTWDVCDRQNEAGDEPCADQTVQERH